MISTILSLSGKHQNPQNNPKLVVLGGITLPLDVLASVDNEKEIAVAKILDGVAVFERILRKPAEISFEMTVRELNNTLHSQLTNPPYLEFPQAQLVEIYKSIWLIDSVLEVQNTMLNNVYDITQVVLRKISITPARGAFKAMVRIDAYENYVGTNSMGTTLFVK